jgi:hypothetical protein
VLIGTHTVFQPANGLTPSKYTSYLDGWSVQTGKRIWSEKYPSFFGGVGPSGVIVATTSDNRWAVVFPNFTDRGVIEGAGAYVMYPATGALRGDPLALAVAGNYIVDGCATSFYTLLTTRNPTGKRVLGRVETGWEAQRGLVKCPANPASTLPLLNVDPSGATGDLAEQGVISNPVGDPNPAGITGDATGVIALADKIERFSLPSFAPKWSVHVAVPIQTALWADYGGVLVISYQNMQIQETTLEGLSDSTGRTLWHHTLPSVGFSSVRGITSSEVLVRANDENVVLDSHSGRQLIANSPFSSADTLGRAFLEGSNSIEVVQALRP